MSRWKRLASKRFVATTLVLFASSIGGMAGCEIIAQVDRSEIDGSGGAPPCIPENDQSDCTIDTCNSDGTTTHTPQPEGTACTSNGGSKCDDAGACVQCFNAEECPGTDDACQTRTCTAGACGFDYTAADTPLPTQTAGDCKIAVCDGAGATVDNNDDTDLPDDSNACTDDLCNMGTPSNPNLAQGTDCTAGGPDPLVCNDMGQCVGCNTPADCPGTDDECSTRTCSTAGVCGVTFTAADTPVAAQTDNDCLLHVCDGNGNFVDIADDADLPLDDGNACTGETCAAGMPMHPNLTDGAPCSDGDLCTPMDTCQMGTCTPGTAITCTASDQCHVVGTCDPTSGMCSNPAATDGTTCDDGDLCTPMDTCQTGACTAGTAITCTASDQCHIAGTCDPATGMCSDPAATDGTACDDGTACTQTDSCMAGTCTGANPVVCMAADECHVVGMCDAMSGMCSTPAAPDGTTCTSNSISGMCTAGTCVACGDGIVGGAETCDDGNTNADDGCSATCATETGFTCTGIPSTCAPTCGDNLIRGTEVCDDGNTTAGDGCSDTCQLDISCGAGEVSVILTNNTSTPIPDAIATANGGVLSLTNVNQAGVVRKVIPMINVTYTNTLHLRIFLTSPYGVQRELATEIGTSSSANFVSTMFSDAAAQIINAAGLTAPFTGTYRSEQSLSDAAGFGNQTATGDWALSVIDDTTGTTGTLDSWSLALCIDPSVTSVCGNGYVEPSEQCDDGNANSGDGCASCQLEVTCGANETLVVQTSTNGTFVIPDNNATGASSVINIGNTGVVAKAVVVVNAISHPYDGDLSLSLTSPAGTARDLSSLNGSTLDHYVSTIFDDAAATAITSGSAPYRGRYRPEAALNTLNGQPSNGDWTFKAVDSANGDVGHSKAWSLGLCVAPPPVCGNGTVEAGEGCDDGNMAPGDGCSDTCTVEQGWACTGAPMSTCMFTCGNGTVSGNEQCDDGNTTDGDTCSSVCLYETTPEVEGNNACGMANGPLTVPVITSGAITPIGDLDLFSFTVPAYADVRIETFAGPNKTCPTIDTVIELRGTDCNTILLTKDQGGVGNCSLINPTLPADAAARHLAPGTYFVRVNEYLNNGTIPNYFLEIKFTALCGNGVMEGSEQCDGGAGCGADCTIIPACGDGFISAGEECDDMNMTDGDGCSSTCTVEADYHCTTPGPSTCTIYESNCSDGIDNDGDTNTDATDSDCTLPAYFPGCMAGETLRVYPSFDTPLTIVDNNPVGALSTVRVVDNIGNIASGAVLLNIAHAYLGDVVVTLTSPGMTSFDLVSGIGGSNDNFTNTLLHPACPPVTGGTAPYSGCFAPEGSLLPLLGTPGQGVWQLRALDNAAGIAGTLTNWKLAMCIAP